MNTLGDYAISVKNLKAKSYREIKKTSVVGFSKYQIRKRVIVTRGQRNITYPLIDKVII